MNRTGMSKVNGMSMDQFPRTFQSLWSTNSVRSLISRVWAGSVDGTRAHKLACFVLTQRHAVANGQPSRSSIILLILVTVDTHLLHLRPSSGQRGERWREIYFLCPITLFSLSFIPQSGSQRFCSVLARDVVAVVTCDSAAERYNFYISKGRRPFCLPVFGFYINLLFFPEHKATCPMLMLA